MINKAYDPLLDILKELRWVYKNIRQRKGTEDEVKFLEIKEHLEKELSLHTKKKGIRGPLNQD